MILKALTLENFKGIGEPVRIEFAPLTLLFGPNNAGKSTIVQALMYAQEVLKRNNCDAGRTVVGGDVVDLGGFRNLVYAHNTSHNIRMRFELALDSDGLPDFLSPERHAELKRKETDLRRGKFRNMRDALGLDPTLLQWSRQIISGIWVEIEVGQRKPVSPSSSAKPAVICYSVGIGSEPFATVSLDQDTDRATLSYLNFGLPPFGSSYSKGELSNSQWDMERICRRELYSAITQTRCDVAFAGEPSGADVKRISKEVFDEGVAHNLTQRLTQAQQEGTSKDEQEQTNRPKSPLPSSTDLANNMAKKRKRLEEERRQVTAGSGIESDEFVRGINEPHGLGSAIGKTTEEQLHLELRSLPDAHVLDTTQWQGWLLTWFDKLAPFFEPLARKDASMDKWRLANPLPLATRGTAMPDWEIGFEPYSNIWGDDFEDVSSNSWADLAREYLIALLNSIIVKPGELVLQTLERARYLSPFRKLPARDYRPSSGPDGSSWAAGLAAWNILSTGSEGPLRASVSDWLTSPNRFGTHYRVVAQRRKALDVDGDLWNSLVSGELRSGSDELKEYLESLPEDSKLELQHIESGLFLAPQDLGVGISQVIPVIVAALHNPSGQGARVVMIEEPESNIHPAFQVVLADLFLTQAKANQNALFLIETHSEHLLLRVMRRMRETFHGKQTGELAVEPSDVSVLFVERCDGHTCVYRRVLNEAGEFVKGWPVGFFEEALREHFGDD